MRQLLVWFALILTAAPAAAKPHLIDVPGRRATSRRGRGYSPEALVRALRMRHNQLQTAPVKAAALPKLREAKKRLDAPGNRLTRHGLYQLLEHTPYNIGRQYYTDFRAEVPFRYYEKGEFFPRTVENPEALPAFKKHVSTSLGDAARAKRLKERGSIVETTLRKYMDGRFVDGRRGWKEKLGTASDEQLFDAARTMIGRINDMAHGKSVPEQKVGSGRSSSSYSHKTLFTSASASSSSSFELSQLIPNAATYTFRVADGANHGRGDIIPQRARSVVEMGIQVQDINRELGRRKSKFAAPVARWVGSSRLSFEGVSGKRGAEVRMDRASVEALRLQGMNILSPRMVKMLEFEKKQTSRQAMNDTNPLLD